MAGHLWLVLATVSSCFVLAPAQMDTTDNCDPGLFACRNGRCLSTSKHCDGNDDCGDGSDEIACGRGACVEGWFTCRNGECIRMRFVCDFQNDCGDNTDEGPAADCDVDDLQAAQNRTCAGSHFECRSKDQCIPVRFKCDGRRDCLDHSDEDFTLCYVAYQAVKHYQESAACPSHAQVSLMLFQGLMTILLTLARMM